MTMLDIMGGQDYLTRQLKKHIGLLHDLTADENRAFDASIPGMLGKIEACWSQITNKYYNHEGKAVLNINNSNQYTQLLLILAHELSQGGHAGLADKFFGLNKMLNGCDIYHEVKLPRSFYIDHSLGIVVGRAHLGERLFLSQGCTIGSNPGSALYPTLGNDNYLMANATVVGGVKTGDRVIFAANSYAKDIEIPSDRIVFGQSPNIVIKNLEPEAFKKASPFKQG